MVTVYRPSACPRERAIQRVGSALNFHSQAPSPPATASKAGGVHESIVDFDEIVCAGADATPGSVPRRVQGALLADRLSASRQYLDGCSTTASGSHVELVPERVRGPHHWRFAHDAVPKQQPRLVRIVRAAPQLDVRDGRLAARGIRLHVVELEKRGLATASFTTDECATACVAPPDATPYRRRNMARPRRVC